MRFDPLAGIELLALLTDHLQITQIELSGAVLDAKNTVTYVLKLYVLQYIYIYIYVLKFTYLFINNKSPLLLGVTQEVVPEYLGQKIT